MRKVIEDLNRLPKKERLVPLAKIRETLRIKPEQVQELVQQLELGRGMGQVR